MVEEKTEEVKQKSNNRSLYIGRLPPNVRNEFLDLANSEEFLGDYGFCLKWLIDFRNGLLSNPNQMLLERIDLLAQEIELLKSNSQKAPEKKTIMSLAGTKIIERGE